MNRARLQFIFTMKTELTVYTTGNGCIRQGGNVNDDGKTEEIGYAL